MEKYYLSYTAWQLDRDEEVEFETEAMLLEFLNSKGDTILVTSLIKGKRLSTKLEKTVHYSVNVEV